MAVQLPITLHSQAEKLATHELPVIARQQAVPAAHSSDVEQVSGELPMVPVGVGIIRPPLPPALAVPPAPPLPALPPAEVPA